MAMWWAVVLAALSATAASMGLPGVVHRRDLRLSAEMGVSPDVLRSLKKSVHAIAKENAGDVIAPHYASVRDFQVVLVC